MGCKAYCFRTIFKCWMACRTMVFGHVRRCVPQFLNLSLRNNFWLSLNYYLFKKYLMITHYYYWCFKRIVEFMPWSSCMHFLLRIELLWTNIQLAIFDWNDSNKVLEPKIRNQMEILTKSEITYLNFSYILSLTTLFRISWYFKYFVYCFFCPFFSSKKL